MKVVEIDYICKSGSKVIIMRHFKTEYNKLGRLQGLRNNSPIVYSRGDLLRVRHFLGEHYPIDMVYVSPLKRCRDTYQCILEAGVKLPISRKLDELKEIDIGDYTGKYKSDVPDSVTFHRHQNRWYNKWPGGESPSDVYDRLESLITELKVTKDKTFLIICHQVVARVLAYGLINISLDEYLKHDERGIWDLDNDQAFILTPGESLVKEDI